VISSHWPDVAEITDGQTILPFWYGSAAYLVHLVSPWVFWLNLAHVAKIRTMARPNSLDTPPIYTKELRVARYNHHHKTTTTKKILPAFCEEYPFTFISFTKFLLFSGYLVPREFAPDA